MDDSLKQIYGLWNDDKNRVSDGELSLFILNFKKSLVDYLQNDNKRKIFSSMKSTLLNYLTFLTDMSQRYPPVYKTLASEVADIYSILINPFNDLIIRRVTFRSAVVIALFTPYPTTVKKWGNFFAQYFLGQESQKLNVGTPTKADITEYLHDLDCMFQFIDESKKIENKIKLWQLILSCFFNQIRHSTIHIVESRIYANAITRRFAISLSMGEITPLTIENFSYECIIECLEALLTSINYEGEIAITDQILSSSQVAFDYLIHSFPYRFNTDGSKGITPDSKKILKYVYYHPRAETQNKLNYIIKLQDYEFIFYKLLSVYSSFISKTVPMSKQFQSAVLHMRMIIAYMLKSTKSTELLQKLISFICAQSDHAIIMTLVCLYLAISVDFYDSDELYFSKFVQNVSVILEQHNFTNVICITILYFSTYLSCMFMRSLTDLEKFPELIDLANLNPLKFALKSIVSIIESISQIATRKYTFPFLFSPPKNFDKEKSLRYILNFVDTFNPFCNYVLLPAFCEACFHLVNYIFSNELNLDVNFLTGPLFERLVNHISSCNLPNRNYSLVISSKIILSEILRTRVSTQHLMKWNQALVIATTGPNEEFFAKSFYISAGYFLDAAPFSFSIFHVLTSSIARMTPDKQNIYVYTEFLVSSIHVIMASKDMSIPVLDNLVNAVIFLTKTFKQLRVVDSTVSHVLVAFSNAKVNLQSYKDLISGYMQELPNLSEIPSTFLSCFAQLFLVVNEMSTQLADEYIECLFKLSKQHEYFSLSCRLIVDIMLQLEHDSQQMLVCLSFMHRTFTRDRDRKKRNEEYLFFLANYNRQCKSLPMNDDVDLVLVGGVDSFFMLKRNENSVNLHTSHKAGNARYEISIEGNKQFTDVRNSGQISDSWKVFLGMKQMPIFVEMLNEASQNTLQVAPPEKSYIEPFSDIFKRSFLAKYIVKLSCIDDATNEEMIFTETPISFRNFCNALGSVNSKEGCVEIDCKFSPRNDILFKYGQNELSQIHVIWDCRLFTPNSTLFTQNKADLEIVIHPLESGFLKVRMRAGGNFKNGPLMMKQIISRRDLPFLLKQTIVQFCRTTKVKK